MRLLITIAKLESGQVVAPLTARREHELYCVEREAGLNLRAGDINRWHFAHKACDSNGSTTECSGGGESAKHKAAKIIIADNIGKFIFEQSCKSGKHSIRKQYTNCVAQQEATLDTGVRADVAVYNNKQLVGIIEILHTHTTKGSALRKRHVEVGVNDTWEIRAQDIIDTQHKLAIPGVYITLNQKDLILPECDKRACYFINNKQLGKPCVSCYIWKDTHTEVTIGYSQYPTDFICQKCIIICPECNENQCSRKQRWCFRCAVLYERGYETMRGHKLTAALRRIDKIRGDIRCYRR